MDYSFLKMRKKDCPRRGLSLTSKMDDLMKDKKGQGTLEMAFVLIIAVLLLGGILNIWLWGNKQMVVRQLRYNQSRVAAGTSSDTYTLQWPVYTPEELKEDKVLLDAP